MFSYDLWEIECDYLQEFLLCIDHLNIRIYHLKKVDDSIFQFIAKSIYRFKISKQPYQLNYIRSLGRYRYLFNFFLNKNKLLFVFVFLFTIYISTSFLWSIHIEGHYPSINDSLKSYLKQEYIHAGNMKLSLEQLDSLSDKIKKYFKDDIDYLNLYQKGTILYLDYTKKIEDDKVELDYRNIYACKPGMITSFEVNSGNIKVKVNDYVEQGELLIENTILSSREETKFVPTLGKVYAYTFLDVEARMPKGDSGDRFNELLLKIRETLPKGSRIEKENVIQFKEQNGQTIMKVHYTLIENIACKGE